MFSKQPFNSGVLGSGGLAHWNLAAQWAQEIKKRLGAPMINFVAFAAVRQPMTTCFHLMLKESAQIFPLGIHGNVMKGKFLMLSKFGKDDALVFYR